MLTLSQIEHLIEAERFEQLLARVIEGGRCPAGCAADLRRACGGRGVVPAALGFALQRITELTYAPCPPARTLAGRLIGLQQTDGLWGEGAASLAPSAIGLRGLLDLERRHEEFHTPKPAGIEESIDRGARAIASIQRGDGSMGRSALDSAVVLWQLGQSHMWLPIRFFDLRRSIERGEAARGNAEEAYAPLRRLACAAAAAA